MCMRNGCSDRGDGFGVPCGFYEGDTAVAM